MNESLPILMYHSISDAPEKHARPYYCTHTSPHIFADQMAWLQQQGYTGVNLKTGLEMWRCGRVSSTKLVAITFDDGFRDFFFTAAPILCNVGFSATIFLPTGFIGSSPKMFKNRQCMTWDEVIKLHRMGFELGSHTVTHPKMTELPWASVIEEVRNSKTELEERLGEPVTSFAYPYAFPQADKAYAARFVDLLRREGYRCNATTSIGRTRARDNPYLLRRLPVNDYDDHALLAAKLDGAYDWLAWPQNIFKRAKLTVQDWRVTYFQQAINKSA